MTSKARKTFSFQNSSSVLYLDVQEGLMIWRRIQPPIHTKEPTEVKESLKNQLKKER